MTPIVVFFTDMATPGSVSSVLASFTDPFIIVCADRVFADSNINTAKKVFNK
jgi:hypothetical protein